jgi:hypothetical protein
VLHRSYPLEQSPLYRLRNRRRLAAEVFCIELPLLERLAAKGGNYRVFHVHQGDKLRQVEVPKAIVERLHRRLFALLARIEKPSYLHSGVKKRSYLTNAREHLGKKPMVKLDLKKFYPSVRADMVYRFFHGTLQCSPDVAGLLTKLSTCNGHVPTGSCLSQLLAFFAVKPLFDDLDSVARAEGLCFTVYVDDMTFSGSQATPALLWKVKQLVHSRGLKYHKDKFYPAEMPRVVTGVLIDGDRLAVQPSKEFAMWQQMQALGDGDEPMRRAALERLIGSAVAASQIETRFLDRVRKFRDLQRQTIASATAERDKGHDLVESALPHSVIVSVVDFTPPPVPPASPDSAPAASR